MSPHLGIGDGHSLSTGRSGTAVIVLYADQQRFTYIQEERDQAFLLLNGLSNAPRDIGRRVNDIP
jgi:hypothetical protein